MARLKRFGLWSAITCGFLAGVMSTEPLELKAASQGAYLSDVIVITDKDIEKAKTDGYTVMDMPLGEQSLRQEKTGSAFTKTYVAYKTTSKTEEAIRDMKFINMNGGFDFAKYDEYLEGLEDETKQSTNDLFVSIEGYRKYYKKNTPEGKYAYEALNVFRYDEFDGLESAASNETGINMRLGDLFLNEELIPDGDSKILVDIFMESNSTALDAIYSALSIANTYDENGKNVFENLEENKNLYYMFADRTDLNPTFSVFNAGFYSIREDVNWYNTSAVCKYEDFKDTDEALAYSYKLLEEDVINQTTYANSWNNVVKEIPFLKNIDYKGLSGTYENLLDLIMDEDADPSEYYPLLACMSPGLRGTAFLGIMETLTNSLLDRSRYSERLELLKDKDEDAHRIVVDEGISVFYGVDRSLFKKGNVAMTTDAEKGVARGEMEWMNRKSFRYEADQKLSDILKYVSIGLGGLICVEGIGFLIARGVYGPALQKASEMAADALKSLNNYYKYMPISTGTFGEIEVVKTGGVITYEKVIKVAGNQVSRTALTEEQAAALPGMSRLVGENSAALRAQNTAMASYNKHLSAAAPLKRIMFSVKLISAISITICVVALAVTLALFIVNELKERKPVYNIYAEVPGILCHRQPIYNVYDNGTRSKAENDGYVYYYGAINPYTVATKAKFGNDDDGTLELGENKRNVQDIFNWELGEGKSREWLCLYFTKDVRANYPITTSSLKLLGEVGETISGAAYFNNPNIEYDINTVLVNNYYDDRNIKNDTKAIQKTNTKYLRYAVNAKGDLKRSSAASAISNPTTWGLVAAGLAVGLAGGLLTFALIDKKKKKARA